MKTNKKGISLIVLIITIIVVIILAAAVILSMNNNNPISSAKEATFKSDIRSFQDELAMTISKQYTDLQGQRDKKINADKYTKNGEEDSVYTYIPSFITKYENKISIVDDKLVWIGQDDEQKDWFTSVIGNTAVSTNTVPDNWKNSIASVTSENVPIPKGFTYLTGTKDTGVVIQDSIGNEFVWVPVSTSVPYEKWCTVGMVYNSSGISDDSLPNGVSNESTDVTTYGGFYIGRYEAGVPDNQTTINGTSSTTSNVSEIPTSKKGKASWTCIDYTNSKANAESMYASSTSVKSGLLTGTSWDTTCNWIKQSGKNITDSRSYGNYNNSTSSANVTGYGSKQVTGYSDKWSANNIYDLAGNVWEWTAEAYSFNRVIRGGNYDSGGDNGPVSYRNLNNASNTYGDVGFRVRLYIQ